MLVLCYSFALAVVSLVMYLHLSKTVCRTHAAVATLGTAGFLAAGLAWFSFPLLADSPKPVDLELVNHVTSVSCRKCHESHHDSWHRSYHRSMTREATAENVKGDFDSVSYRVKGVTSHMTREGDTFFMETLDANWADQIFRAGKQPSDFSQVPLKKFRVDRLIGSHWLQEYLHKDPAGRYGRMPLAYHIVEKRWIHMSGAFLAPDNPHFYAQFGVWNETCVYCHNTKAQKNRTERPWPLSSGVNYRTEVEELGIACEACHGPGAEHVRANSNPLRRFDLRRTGRPDPTIVNPARLTAQRSAEVCGHCHAGAVPIPGAWENTHRDPYTPGQELTRFYNFFWSSPQQIALGTGTESAGDDPYDGRFWRDGTPLTTALEYQGMALSACYQNGTSGMTCLSCHSMHKSDPNHQVSEGMRTNQACYQCHPSYQDQLAQHTRHAAESSGSLCYNCHMPYQAYSLLDSHRSHRIEVPRVKNSVGTGKPHACNLCHLDKSLAWTQRTMSDWYGQAVESMSDEDEHISASVVLLFKGDARSRGVVAASFSRPASQEASGTSWMPEVLLRAMEDPYPAVRYLAFRALRSLPGQHDATFDYLAFPTDRELQIEKLFAEIPKLTNSDRQKYPAVPLRGEHNVDAPAISALTRLRDNTPVTINE